jgi:hypothetical protein
MPLCSAFKSREPTGEIWTPQLDAEFPGRDWILTRILWLDGVEPGKNKGGMVDTHARYIYIHGTHEEHKIGTPASHGCIRMKNADVAELFDLVEDGDRGPDPFVSKEADLVDRGSPSTRSGQALRRAQGERQTDEPFGLSWSKPCV